MKNFLILTLLALLVTACPYYYDEPPVEPYFYSEYEPVIIKREFIDSTTKLVAARDIVKSGKIYVKDNLLFINEVNEGFHIFDNTDPANPVNKAFLKVLGSTDLSIKDSTIYVNNAVDLIALKPNEDLTKVSVKKRVKNVFPQMQSPDGYRYYDLDKDDIIINWTERKKS